MGMTLADMSALGTLTPFAKRVLYSILMPSPLISQVPFEDVGDIKTLAMEIRQLPTIAHRPLNPSSIAIASASFGNRVESLSIISNQMRIDRQMLDNQSSHVNPKTAEMEAFTKAVAYTMVDRLINGDPVTNVDHPAGLLYRFSTDLRLSDGSAAPGTQKQVLDANKQNRDLTLPAEQLGLMDDVHHLLSLLDGGDADVLISNRQGTLALGRAARAARMFRTDKDSFARKVDMFGDIPIVDAGHTAIGAFTRGTQVIPTSTSTDDYADCIIAVKWGQTAVGGLQKRAPETTDFKEDVSSFPMLLGSYEHVYGWHVTNPFNIAIMRRAF